MRHRKLDSTRADVLRPRGRAAAQVHGRLRPPADLDLLPGEVDAGAERLPDRLLGREPPRIVLRRVRLAVAVRALQPRKAALRQACPVRLERAPDPLDLDQVDADAQPTLTRCARASPAP